MRKLLIIEIAGVRNAGDGTDARASREVLGRLAARIARRSVHYGRLGRRRAADDRPDEPSLPEAA